MPRIHRRRTAAIAAGLLAALALGGCAATAATPAVEDYVRTSATSGFAGGAELTSSPYAVAADIAEADRSIITTGWITITSEDPAADAAEAISIVEAAGGRADARSEVSASTYDGGSATVVLRIPSAALTRVVEQLKDLGEVQEISLNAQDVTMEVQDIEARILALEAAIARLTDLLADADSTADLIDIEEAITNRQIELDSLDAQQRYYSDQVSMSTISVGFVTERVVPEPDPDTFGDGVVAGWKALVAFATAILVGLGAFIPWLIPLAILAGIAWLIVRLVRRRRAKAALASAAAAAEPAEEPAPTS